MRSALLSIALVSILLFTGCSQEVQTGSIVWCKKCGKEIHNTVAVIKVPVSKADQYRVTREYSYCEDCGNEKVPYEISRRCKQCGKTYSSRTGFAARRTEPKGRSETIGYCSESCRRTAKVDETIDKISEKTGDVLGRVGKGIFEGVKKHTR